MKKLFVALALSALHFTVLAADEPKQEAPKTKQVCTDVKGKDGKPVKNKDGTTKQTCKTVKVHKKYKATEVPTTPPKK
jgi:hypothetical protein